MASYAMPYALPHHLVWAIRKADVLTGEFLRPVSADVMTELAVLGLASVADGALTRCGMELRSWLMCGTDRAPHEVSRLLRAAAGNFVPARFADATGRSNDCREAIFGTAF